MKLLWFTKSRAKRKQLDLDTKFNEEFLRSNAVKRDLEEQEKKLVDSLAVSHENSVKAWEDKELPEVIWKNKLGIAFLSYEDVCIPLRDIRTVVLLDKGECPRVEPYEYTDPEIYNGVVLLGATAWVPSVTKERPAVIQIVYHGGLFNIEVSPFYVDRFYSHIKDEWKNNYGS